MTTGGREARGADHFWAATVMAVVPSALAIGTIRFGGYCHAERIPGLYGWGCMFPVSIVMASIGFLLLVPGAIWAQRGLFRLGPVGWLVVPLAAGMAMQIAFGVVIIASAGNGGMTSSIGNIARLPWPFAAGTLAGGTYWTVLQLRRALIP